MKNQLSIFVFLVCGLLSETVLAQNCRQNYLDANAKYVAGYWAEVLPILMDSCFIKRDYGNEVDLINALMLRTQLALRKKNDSIAMNFMQEILEINPRVEVDSTYGDIELMYLRRKFKVLYPMSTLFYAGSGNSIFRVGESYSISSVNSDSSIVSRASVPSVFAGVRIQMVTRWGVGLTFGASVAYDQYLYSERLQTSGLERIYTELDFREYSLSVTTPVGLRWGLPESLKEEPSGFRRFLEKPYVHFAVEPSFVLDAQMRNLNRVLQTDGAEPDDQPDIIFSDKSINLLQKGSVLRNRFQGAAYAGVGWRFPLKNSLNTLVIEAGYSFSLINVVYGNNRYLNDKLLYAYGYVDDNFYQDRVRIMVAYSINSFKVKRISE